MFIIKKFNFLVFKQIVNDSRIKRKGSDRETYYLACTNKP